jgi:hypothetical protein
MSLKSERDKDIDDINDAEWLELEYTRSFTDKEFQLLKRGFISSDMDYKWNFYFDNGDYILERSWIKTPIYKIILNDKEAIKAYTKLGSESQGWNEFNSRSINEILDVFFQRETEETGGDEESTPDSDYFIDKDYYKILGISFDASSIEIKKAFRKLASSHHPDRGGNEGDFQLITEAYSTLNNVNKRELYDEQFKNQQQEEYAEDSKPDAPSEESTHEPEEEQVFSDKPDFSKSERNTTPKNTNFIKGIIFLSIGLVITFVSYGVAGEGGGFVVTFGFIIYGLYLIFKDDD